MDNDRDHLFDVRVVDRNIVKGKITREEYEAHLASLEDCADLAEDAATRFTHSRYVEVGDDEEDDLTDEDDGG